MTTRDELDGMGTDELHAALTQATRGLPADHPVRVIWEQLDEILTAGGVECLPAPWDNLPRCQGHPVGETENCTCFDAPGSPAWA
ncbi:hypothetical protein ABT095_15085 [Kitasatospora sp. NPDC002227]|uniref:hypothetical protein n=1 Tax=Kitasatospora sp. NPDC002227 TaxID=3154773 RepID=UPI00332C681A